MTDSPQESHVPIRHKEFEDPQYHDEDLEIQNDENRQRRPFMARKPVRRPMPRRRFEDD